MYQNVDLNEKLISMHSFFSIGNRGKYTQRKKQFSKKKLPAYLP